jgi:hypothetical protein
MLGSESGITVKRVFINLPDCIISEIDIIFSAGFADTIRALQPETRQNQKGPLASVHPPGWIGVE